MTQTRQIVIVPADALDAARVEGLARTGPFAVCYLGGSFTHYTALRERLPTGWSMPFPGARLNDAANRLRDDVINLDLQAQPSTMSRLEWDASLLAERGPLVSSLMLNLARLVVFLETAAEMGRHLVVVDSFSFGCLLLREAKERGWDAGWLAPGCNLDLGQHLLALHETLADFVDGARRRASVVRRFSSRKLQLAVRRRRHAVRLDELRRTDALVVVWGRANTFPAHGPLVNEYNFGRLPALLRQADLAVGYLAYPLTYVSPFAAIARNALTAGDPVALMDDFIPWWAIVPAAFSGLTFPRRIGRLSVLGIDATSVLRLEARRERRLSVSAEARLLAYVGDGLARRGIRPKLLLHLYESQPWEKMLAAGVRRHLPLTRIVALQHAPFAWNYLSFFPSRRNIAEGALPDLLLTTGEGYAQWFRHAGIPSARVGVVGAVRFEAAAGAAAPRGRAVLCCTSIERDEAIELATTAAAAMDGLSIPLIINFHPVTDAAFRTAIRNAVDKVTRAGSSYITFSNASVRDLLEQTGVVLYMSSAVCFEAVQAGRAAVYVNRDLALDYDKLPNDIALPCASRDALRETVQRLVSAAQINQSPAALAHWLAPVVDADALRRLLSVPDPAGAATGDIDDRYQEEERVAATGSGR